MIEFFRQWLTELPRIWVLDIARSGALIIALISLRIIFARALATQPQLTLEIRRRWSVNFRNALIIFGLTCLSVIWMQELATLAVSMVAIAAAIAISGKEMIMCFVGSLYRTMVKSYSVGDHIEINGIRGRVIDINLFGTTVMEIGPGRDGHQMTGRAISLPNSLLLSHPVIREDFTDEFIVHVVSVPVSVAIDLMYAQSVLLAAAEDFCAPFIEEAEKHMARIESMNMVDTPSVRPRASLQLVDDECAKLMVRIAIPPTQKQRAEQAILQRFIREVLPSSKPAPH